MCRSVCLIAKQEVTQTTRQNGQGCHKNSSKTFKYLFIVIACHIASRGKQLPSKGLIAVACPVPCQGNQVHVLDHP
ncbi:hypothetical protein CJ030_MR8G005827 [Morella rubra]|uniref:Uncharacterized protein n=1 Tax=Morella rubra TaxID=262757 RepID=A0A6A1UQR8_9ROSI|nr:hypothetical protein CJ030_MR8G005827 [Morella rubra]